MTDKTVIIFPYININKILKMGDFEIYPIGKYNFKDELKENELINLESFLGSFRKTFLKNEKFQKSLNEFEY